MGRALLLLICCCLVTTACPQDVPGDRVVAGPEDPPPGTGPRDREERRRREPDRGPARCRLQPTVLGVPGNGVSSSAAGPDVVLVPEGVAENAVIALVEMSDADSGVECKLEADGNFRLVKTYERNYVIVTNTSLDREERMQYNLTLIAEDNRSPSFTSTVQITVKVTDENDNAPVFSESAYRASVMENALSNTTILTVTASDVDLGANGQVTYSILDFYVSGTPISSLIGIHPTAGTIYALEPCDYERTPTVDFVVEARDGGQPPARATVPVRLDVVDLNDNRPVFTSPAWPRMAVPIAAEPAVGGDCADGLGFASSSSRRRQSVYPVTTVKAEDADSGANGELLYKLVGGDGEGVFSVNGSTGEIRAAVCNVGDLLAKEWTIVVCAGDRGSPSLSSRTLLKLTFVRAMDPNPASERLGAPVVAVISLGALCPLVLLATLVLFRNRHKSGKRDPRAYNCRHAETAYQLHPKRPQRQIQKTDITLLHPGRRGGQEERSPGPPSSPPPPPPLRARTPEEPPSREEQVEAERPYPTLRRDRDSHHHQLLRELVRLSMAGFSDCTLELTPISPHVQQISQLLSLLHQGQFQPRPNFRGNKYLKNYRVAMQEADRVSLKDSGQGESEEGDSDSDTGRNSPIDRLLEEGLSDLLVRGGWTSPTVLGSRASASDELSLEDLCWMLPSSLPLRLQGERV
ncbi:protocadherin-18-like [Heptranchias perlo]|uniref:protocadherin-18-like n=1 Tax=Heptranchias perlo TaxID=212740 RepID=UPI003559CCA2